MSDSQKTTLFAWTRFIVGCIGVTAFMLVHIYIKELPPWLIAMPGALWGVDLKNAWGGKK